MVDRLSQTARSSLMGRVRHHGTAPELLLRKALWAAGLRYRLKTTPRLPGSPDLLFPSAKLAIFIDGCFWHGCPLHGTQPKTRSEFWFAKISRNKERDIEVNRELQKLGWTVVRFWQHDVEHQIAGCVAQIRKVKKFKELKETGSN